MNRFGHLASLFVKLLIGCAMTLGLSACGQPATPTTLPPTEAPVSQPPAAGATVITLVADHWCPYTCDPASAHPGYIIEVAREIFEKAGYQVKYEAVPWSRAIKGVQEGSYAGAAGAAKGDIPEAVFPTESLGKVENDFYVRQGDPWRFTGIAALNSIHLGVIGDYYYSDEINAYLEAHKNSPQVDIIQGDDAVRRNLIKLQEGKIDAYLEDRNVILYTLGETGLDKDKLEGAGSLGQPDSVYIAFDPHHPESKKWAEILSAGIRELRASGRLTEILQRYGLQDWE